MDKTLITAGIPADIATPGGIVPTTHARSPEPDVAEQEAVDRCRDDLARDAARLGRPQVLAEADADLGGSVAKRRMTGSGARERLITAAPRWTPPSHRFAHRSLLKGP